MVFEKNYNISDVLTIISIVLVVFGGLFSLFQYIKTQKLQRGKYITELISKLRDDSDIKEVFYMIEYNRKIWYNYEFHEGGDMETKVDKTLSYLSYFCYLKKKRLIMQSEFEFIEYQIIRVLINEQMKNYLYNLYHFSKRYKVNPSFYYLYEYGKNKKYYSKEHNKKCPILETEFFNAESQLYPHFLSF